MQNFLRFLDASPTYYHAKKEISSFLAEKKFSPLNIKEKWNLQKNQGYFVSLGSLLIAFKMPNTLKKIAIVASHLDSPGFKLKPHPDLKCAGLSKLATAVYGGPIYSTWANIKLGLAGKIIFTDENNKLKHTLINIDKHPIMIAQPAIHLQQTINKDPLSPLQLNPLFSLTETIQFEDLLGKYISYKTLIDFDLFVYPLERSSLIGLEHEMVASYRLDNLASAYSSMKALTESTGENALIFSIFYNHEEIGSKTSQGAFSLFFEQVLQKIIPDAEELLCLKQTGICVSCDLTHGYDSTYVEKYDSDNTPFLGKGMTIKYDSKQNYATSIETASYFSQLASKNNLSIQKYHVKSDSKAGSTIGPVFESKHGIRTVDVGIPCLSMHATNEVISVRDLEEQTSLLKAFYDDPLPVELLND